jgi:hypothetical protein
MKNLQVCVYKMPPKHRQLRAPRPKASGNAFQALVDPPHNGNNLSFDGGDEGTDGGDEGTDGSDDNTVVNTHPGDSGADLALIQRLYMALTGIITPITQLAESYDRNDLYMRELNRRLVAISDGKTTAHDDDRVRSDDRFAALESKMDNLLQKMDATWTENTALREAYRASREETAMLKAAVDTLTKKLDESTAMSAPPLTGNRDHLHSDGGNDDATVPRPERHPGRPGRSPQPSWQEKAAHKRPGQRTDDADERTTGHTKTARCITRTQPDALTPCYLRRPRGT